MHLKKCKQKTACFTAVLLACLSLHSGFVPANDVTVYAVTKTETKNEETKTTVTSKATEIPKVTEEVKKVEYTISTKTKPCDKSEKYSTYNKYTKHYYTILSYLKQLEAEGGGKLILKKGTYTVTNTLYVPSNVTIIFQDGVTIKKGTKTELDNMAPSKSIFQLVDSAQASTEGVYSEYNGVHDVTFIGEGKVIIDMNYDENALGIMMGHNQNVTIKGITFQNMFSGHFIEMDASKNVVVENCTFQNHKDSSGNNKEAINLDTPDKATGGFHAVWSVYDKTPNENVLIQNCVFKDLERAVGTHKYSEGKLHKNVQILNNKITRCDKDAICVMNWENAVIQGNVVDTVTDGTETKYRGVLVRGVKNMRLTGNEFHNVARAIQIYPWKNSGGGSEYAMVDNILSEEEVELLKNNTLSGGAENFIRWNKTYNVFDKDTVKIPLFD